MVHFELWRFKTKTGWVLFGDGGVLWRKCEYSKNAHLISQKSKKKNRRLRFIISTDLRSWLLKFLLTSESSIMGTMALTHERLRDIQHQKHKGVSNFNGKHKSLFSKFLL